jgi:hypothetical protein
VGNLPFPEQWVSSRPSNQGLTLLQCTCTAPGLYRMSFPHRLPCIALATPHVRTPWWDIMLTDCKPPHAAPHVSLCTTSLMAGVGHHKQHLTQPRAEAPVRDFGSRAPRRPSLHQTFHLTLQSVHSTAIDPLASCRCDGVVV